MSRLGVFVRIYSLTGVHCFSRFSTSKPINKNLKKSDESYFHGNIPSKDVKITFSTSSGPGGQNVNKVATKVDIRYVIMLISLFNTPDFFFFRVHVKSVNWLSEDEKYKVSEKLKTFINKDGWLVLKSDKTRSQTLNQEDAMEKLKRYISQALEPPKPVFTDDELEKIRKGKVKANKERLKNKKFRGETKQNRGGPGF